MEPVRSYAICCVQRTGSWLLAHTLADTGYAGRPSDYFDDAERDNHTREWALPVGDLAAYVRAVREKGPARGAVGGRLAAVVRINGNPAVRGRLRRPRTGQARRRERSAGVSPVAATRCRHPATRPLPQAGRQSDRALRAPRPLSNELPWLVLRSGHLLTSPKSGGARSECYHPLPPIRVGARLVPGAAGVARGCCRLAFHRCLRCLPGCPQDSVWHGTVSLYQYYRMCERIGGTG